MPDAVILNEEAKCAKRRRKPFNKLDSQRRKVLANANQSTPEKIDAQQEDAAQSIERVVGSTANVLTNMADAAGLANRSLRNFQAENRLTRPVHEPNPLVTALLLMIGWVVETVFTATGLFADGHVGIVPALGFAVTFATVNIGIGLAAGFTLRFVNFRQNAIMWTPGIRWVRWTARGAFGVLLGVAAVMIFTGGRVRVTGGHEAVFDFGSVSFGATFNDGLALVVMVAAALSVAVAVAKGFSGFSDPVPGYAVHAHAGDAILGAAEDHVEDALEDIAEIAEAAEEDILDGLVDPDKVQSLVDTIVRHNGHLDEDRAWLASFAEECWQRDCHVAGREVGREPLRTPRLDALEIDPAELDAVQSAIPDLERLRQARRDANARIAEAHSAFLAEVGATRMPFTSTNQ